MRARVNDLMWAGYDPDVRMWYATKWVDGEFLYFFSREGNIANILDGRVGDDFWEWLPE